MSSLKGKVVIVTGASSGFGESTAKLFAQEGCRVVLAARRLDRLEALAGQVRSLGGDALPVSMDVSQPTQITAMVQATLDAYGGIDILFTTRALAGSTGSKCSTRSETFKDRSPLTCSA